jgi:MHS family proline/betaine transporter-like MFS transporter
VIVLSSGAMQIHARADAVTTPASPWSLRRVLSAGVIGNVLEWYDFAVYGFFAPILAEQFFPADNHMVSLLAAFGAFAVGFLMRPVGAVLFGHIGDRYGRARALLISVAMMAVPTVAMGLLPTYATIGVAASILIVVLRMFQGMAVGGEFTSSIVFLAEHAPPRRRGFFSAWAMFGATTGTMLGAAAGAMLSAMLSPEALSAWGWRAAFISGIAVAVVGIIIRRNMYDTPAGVPDISPVRLAFRQHGRQVLRVFGLNLAPAATYYTLFVFAATWVSGNGAVTRATALNITTLSIITFLAIAPCAAWLSDRYGRRLVLMAGMGSCLLLAWPLLWLMRQDTPAVIAAGHMTFAGLLAVYMAAIPAAMCEMFPHSVRVSAVSIGYGLAYAVFGGTAPAIAVWLIGHTGNQLACAWYLMAVTAISLTFARTIPERHGQAI